MERRLPVRGVAAAVDEQGRDHRYAQEEQHRQRPQGRLEDAAEDDAPTGLHLEADHAQEQRAERQKRMQERMAAMTPEERTTFEARMRERGQGGQGGGRGGFGGGDRPGKTAQQGANAGAGNRAGAQRGRVASTPSITSGATTIDSLFGPLPPVESRGRAYLYVNRHLKAVSLRLGVSDGAFTEILDGEGLTEGTEVVVNVMLPDAQRPPAGTGGGNTSPLMGPQRGGPGNRGGGR